jgi:hypothetical protein
MKKNQIIYIVSAVFSAALVLMAYSLRKRRATREHGMKFKKEPRRRKASPDQLLRGTKKAVKRVAHKTKRGAKNIVHRSGHTTKSAKNHIKT